MDLAQAIDTYDVSIRPFDDCCTLFMPKSPTARGKAHIIAGQERRLMWARSSRRRSSAPSSSNSAAEVAALVLARAAGHRYAAGGGAGSPWAERCEVSKYRVRPPHGRRY